MDLSTFQDLLTKTGQEAIRAAMDFSPREKDFLTYFQQLCKYYSREMSRGALETAILRNEARVKFPLARKMYFTRDALQQASSYEVANHRANRFQEYALISDLGCSIGGDTLALTETAPTIGIDRDPLRLALAKANMDALGLVADFIQGDLVSSFPCIHPASSTALFFDPARRADGRRIFSVERYHPPLSIVDNWLQYFPSIGVKISPGVKLGEITAYDAEIEFISLRGELKEAALWFGDLRNGERQASILPGPYILRDDGVSMPVDSKPSQPLGYFYEPDPAVIRAGMVRNLMVNLEASQIDLEIAYLTGAKKKTTPFARVWTVEDWFPFQLKRLRAYLRSRNVGRVTVKKRGSPILPEELIQALRLPKKAPEERVVFLTQMMGRPIVVVCYSVSSLPEKSPDPMMKNTN